MKYQRNQRKILVKGRVERASPWVRVSTFTTALFGLLQVHVCFYIYIYPIRLRIYYFLF